MATTSKCRSCGAAIIFARTANNELMPVDAEPIEDGGVHLFTLDGLQRARVIPPAERPTMAGRLHKSHFATCPNSRQHRKPK